MVSDLPTTSASVIGGDAMNPGDTEETSCIYLNPGVAILTVRIDTAELYDQLPIGTPHTAETVGERGRSLRRDSGGAAVQFLKGPVSIVLDANPVAQSDGVNYYPALINAARMAEARLP